MSIFYTSVSMAKCEIKELGLNSFSLTTDRSTITVLGWKHITDETSADLLRGLRSEISKSSEGVSCSQIEKNLKTIISSQRTVLDHYNSMQTTLLELAQINADTRIGVEQTPQQLRSHQVGIESLRLMNKPLTHQCPSVADELELITSLLYGPDHQVAANLNLKVVPVESDEIKNKNYLDFQVPETFDSDNPRITTDGQEAIFHIRSSILSLRTPDESLINRVVAYETNQVKRAELKKNLRFSINRWIRIMEGAYERNTFIAQQLLKSEAPVVLPIGYLHIDNLREQLSQMCIQEDSFQNENNVVREETRQ
jgi:hypothetical protein